MSVYTAKPATMTKIAPVMARTKNDRSRIANAGVETGAKMLGVSITCCTLTRRARCKPTLSGWFCWGLGVRSRISHEGSRETTRRASGHHRTEVHEPRTAQPAPDGV